MTETFLKLLLFLQELSIKSIFSSLSKKVFFSVSSALLAFGVLTPASYAATFVDTELYLSVDVSGSVNSNEFLLQKQGYVNAFRNQDVQNIIESSQNGLAVALGYWSSGSQQQTAVDFTLLKTAADASNFADLIDATTRPFSGGTRIGPAIDFASNALLNNSFDGSRLVIDVSGDGTSSAFTTAAARDAAVANGIVINGLPIGGAGLLTFFEDNVQGGDGSFSILANDFATIDAAVQQKLFREIATTTPPTTDVPEPGILLGLIGVGASALSLRKYQNSESAA